MTPDNARTESEPELVIGWARWYRLARAEMAFRYGVKGIPVDAYKAEFFMGCTVTQAVRQIVINLGLR